MAYLLSIYIYICFYLFIYVHLYMYLFIYFHISYFVYFEYFPYEHATPSRTPTRCSRTARRSWRTHRIKSANTSSSSSPAATALSCCCASSPRAPSDEPHHELMSVGCLIRPLYIILISYLFVHVLYIYI